MYPPSMTRNRHRDVIGISNKHGLTQVLRQDIRDGWLSRWILPLNTEAQQKNMTWTKTMQWILWLASSDPREWKETQRIGSVQRFNELWYVQSDKVSCSRATLRSARWCSQETCLACSFQFFPHPDRWVPLFDLMSSRRITHARYNSPSVSSSSFV